MPRCSATILIAGLVAGMPALAQQNPEASETRYQLAAAEQPFLHHWRATLSYGAARGPLEDDAGGRIGYSDNQQVLAGIEAGIGSRFFGRVEAGYAWRDGKRSFPFEQMSSDAGFGIVGATGGVFVLPFLSVGLSLQHRREDGKEVFANTGGGGGQRTDRNGHSNRVAPFILLSGPVGGVDLGLLLAYARLRGETDYRRPQLVNGDRRDSGQVNSRLVDMSAGYWVTSDLKLGASIGWTQVLAQRAQASSLSLDEDWVTLGASATYRLTDKLDLNLRADRDIENARGNGFRFGGGLAYRF